jgi:hypothetical protein
MWTRFRRVPLAKALLLAPAAVVALALALTAALPRIVDTGRVQSMIASGLSQALARPVRFRSASVTAWPYPSVRLSGVEIAEDPTFGVDPFVRLDHARVRLKLWPLLRGRVEFATIVLERPIITLAHAPGGRWNFSSLGGSRDVAAAPRAPRAGGGAAPAGAAARLVIARGTVVYERRGAESAPLRQRLEEVDATFSPRGATLAFSGTARVMPGGLRLEVADGSLGAGGARTLAEAGLRGRVRLDGGDVGALVAAVVGDEPAIGGSLTGRLDLGGTVGRPRAAGEIEWRDASVTRTSASCPEPRRSTLTLAPVQAHVTWRDGRLVAESVTGGLGRGTVRARLVAGTAPPVRAELSDLVVERIPLERVLVDFLCLGYAVSGPLDLTGTLSFSPADLARTLNGHGRLRVGAGTVVGARALALLGGLPRRSADVPAALAGAPLEFDAIAGSFDIAAGVVTTRDLVYTGRSMVARARGDFALASGRVNADVVVERDRSVLQARVTGSADAPSIRTPASLARNVEPPERGFRELLKKFR